MDVFLQGVNVYVCVCERIWIMVVLQWKQWSSVTACILCATEPDTEAVWATVVGIRPTVQSPVFMYVVYGLYCQDWYGWNDTRITVVKLKVNTWHCNNTTVISAIYTLDQVWRFLGPFFCCVSSVYSNKTLSGAVLGFSLLVTEQHGILTFQCTWWMYTYM